MKKICLFGALLGCMWMLGKGELRAQSIPEPLYPEKWSEVETYIRDNWMSFVETNPKLPKPYSYALNPGTLYYCDLYFINDALLKQGFEEQARNNLDCFIYIADSLGFLPNAFGWGESRSQFPFFSMMVRDYYEKWYRPDLQGIIVVGDIDVDRIEAKIKELFASIEKPAHPAERVYYPVADNKEPIIAIGTDKEQPNSVVQLMFKYDALPDSLRGSMAYLTTEYMLNMQLFRADRLGSSGSFCPHRSIDVSITMS